MFNVNRIYFFLDSTDHHPGQVPSCRDEVVLLTGHDTNLVAYVWNGTTQAMQVVGDLTQTC